MENGYRDMMHLGSYNSGLKSDETRQWEEFEILDIRIERVNYNTRSSKGSRTTTNIYVQ